MPTQPPPEPAPTPSPTSRALPENPDLRHLKDQAKDLLRAGNAASLTAAQFQIARSYGFASWPKLKAHVDALHEVGQLKQAIDTNDVERVRALMTRTPALHRAPLGYGKDGPLTWVAECRVPWEPPGPARLALAAWMIEHGSDVHQGGDGPLMRAALNDERIPMMELLVARGADVNAVWHGYFPIIHAACEALAPAALKYLLDHGADPNCTHAQRRDVDTAIGAGTALDAALGTYGRTPRLAACIEHLLAAGGVTRFDVPVVLELLRGRLDCVAALLDAEPALLHQRFPALDCGTTAGRRLTLAGATLLHVAAEYGDVAAARLLLDRGADVNARAAVDAGAPGDALGVGGQTPLFHAVTQYHDWGLPVAQLLIDHGADLSLRVKLPGDYGRPEDFVECTPLGYAVLFPGGASPSKAATMLKERGAEL